MKKDILRKVKARTVVQIAVGALCLYVCGCSLIGLGIGSAIDSNKPRQRMLTGWQVQKIKRGGDTEVRLKDGRSLRGVYQGIVDCPEDKYRDGLDTSWIGIFTADSCSCAPSEMSVTWRSGLRQEVEFLGFEHVAVAGLYEAAIRFRAADSAEATTAYLFAVAELTDRCGRRLSSAEIDDRLAAGRLPTITSISLDVNPTATVVLSREDFVHAATVSKDVSVRSVRLHDGRMLEYDFNGGRFSTKSGGISGRSLFGAKQLAQLDEIDSVEIVSPLPGTRDLLIPLSEIDHIVIPVGYHGATIGFLVGLTVDLAAVVIAIAVGGTDMGSMAVESSGGAWSCPFIYSECNGKWIVDSEVFGGALFEAAQRTDVDVLDYLVPDGRAARLKITNEMDETEFVDQLTMIAVDHPVGVTIVPDFSGKLHTVSHPISPCEAAGINGQDVLSSVESVDERWWISNPTTGGSASSCGHRDGLELRFPVLRGVSSAKLVLNLQNTPWAAILQQRVISLHGSEIGSWHQILNSSEAARSELTELMVREGMLSVSVWKGSEWVVAGFVWEIGPRVPREIAFELPDSMTSSDTLAIRLESTAGLWMINSAAIDYSPDTELTVSECHLERASDSRGRDIRPQLVAVDHSYYVMPEIGDSAVLQYAVPDLPTNLQRTYVLRATGYYEIHTDTTSAPQNELISRLSTQPGAFGSYATTLLDSIVRASISQTEETKGE